MPHLGLDPDRVDDLQGVHERLLLRVVGRVVGLVAAGEVRPDAGDLQRRRPARRRPPPRPAPATRSAVAPPRLSPVSTLSCTRARRPSGRAAAATSLDLREWCRRSRRRPPRRRRVVLAGHGQPGRGSARCRPAARSASASSSTATPSQSAPPARAARRRPRRSRGRSRRPSPPSSSAWATSRPGPAASPRCRRSRPGRRRSRRAVRGPGAGLMALLILPNSSPRRVGQTRRRPT